MRKKRAGKEKSSFQLQITDIGSDISIKSLKT
jgi:hypothetical protein